MRLGPSHLRQLPNGLPPVDLAWELNQVQPRVLFTVGDSATDLVRMLQSRRLIPDSPTPHKVMHYSNRGAGITDDVVRASILRDLQSGLNTPHA
jgi:hypothetical protein